MENDIAIIPIRMKSTRLPNKPMKEIFGIPLINHVFERSKLSFGKSLFIAVCDKEIYNYLIKYTDNVIITSKKHKNAISRCYEAYLKIKKKNIKIRSVTVIQGDEPFINPKDLTLLKKVIKKNKVVNLIYKSNELFARDKNNVKVILNKNEEIIYFSREILPSNWKKKNKYYYIQSGLIGFDEQTFIKFNKIKSPNIELSESIDMNRLIFNDVKIQSIKSSNHLLGIDTPKDLRIANKIMKKDNILSKYISKYK